MKMQHKSFGDPAPHSETSLCSSQILASQSYSPSLNFWISRQHNAGPHTASHSLYPPSPGFFPLWLVTDGIHRKPGEALLVFTSSSACVQGAVYWEAEGPRGHCCQSMLEVSEATEWLPPPPPPPGSGSVLAKPLSKQLLSQFSNQQSKQSASGRQPGPLGVTALQRATIRASVATIASDVSAMVTCKRCTFHTLLK